MDNLKNTFDEFRSSNADPDPSLLAAAFCKDPSYNGLKIEDLLDNKALGGEKFLTKVMYGQMNLLHFIIRDRGNSALVSAVVRRRPVLAQAPLDGKLPFFILLDRPDLEGSDVESLHALLTAYPQAAFITDDGLNALMRIFLKQNFHPQMVSLIDVLLDLNVKAAQQDFSGQLPLHLALTSNKPTSTIMPVLEAYPQACSVAYRGKYPLHLAVEHDLDARILVPILEKYPQALLCLVESMNCSLLEYAIKTNKNGAVPILLHGGRENSASCPLNPNCIGYAMAQIDGTTNRDFSFSVIKDQSVVGKTMLHGKPEKKDEFNLHFAVKPYLGEPFPVKMGPAALVEDLEELICLMEGTPRERQKLVNPLGARMLPGEKVADHICDNPISCLLSPPEEINRSPTSPRAAWPTEADRGPKLPIVALKPNTDIFCNVIAAGAYSTAWFMLKRRKAVVYEQDRFGSLPLHVALQQGQADIGFIQELLDVFPGAAKIRAGPSVNALYPLELAIKGGLPDPLLTRFIKMITPQDWSPGGNYIPFRETEVDKRPLLHLCIEHDVNPVKIFELIDTGYPLKVVDKATGLTALEYAVSLHAPLSLVHYLMEMMTADGHREVLSTGPSGKTLLHIACYSKASPDAINQIWRKGGKELLRARDLDGRTPLHVAVEMGLAHDAVRELLMCDPQILFDRDSHGRTALQLAVMNNAAHGVVFELARCSPEATATRDARGRSLLRLAVMADVKPHIVHELLEAAPDLLEEVSLFDSAWPSNAAGREVRRMALLPREDRRRQTSKAIPDRRGSGGRYEAAPPDPETTPASTPTRTQLIPSAKQKVTGYLQQNGQHSSQSAEKANEDDSSAWGSVMGTVNWLFGASNIGGNETSI